MKTIIKAIFLSPRLLPIFDFLLSPFVLLGSIILRYVRTASMWDNRMPISHKIFRFVGLFPIRDHYYEPLFNPAWLKRPMDEERSLPGIDMNIDEQLAILATFDYADELTRFPIEKRAENEFFYHNGAFEAGDAEYFYCAIRKFKPARLVEIGSGKSTQIAALAIAQNVADDPGYTCEHICIEPYEAKWLEKMENVKVIRATLESADKNIFKSLSAGDILFIDSSHVIRRKETYWPSSSKSCPN